MIAFAIDHQLLIHINTVPESCTQWSEELYKGIHVNPIDLGNDIYNHHSDDTLTQEVERNEAQQRPLACELQELNYRD